MKVIYMMDGLEKFVKNNREQFDAAIPKGDIWAGIEEALQNEKNAKVVPLQTSSKPKVSIRYLKIAAVALALITVGGVLGSYLTVQWQQQSAMSLGDISPEYAELEDFYVQQINYNIKKLENTAYQQEVLADLADLDANFKELQQELGTSQGVDKEDLIHLMIENYNTKIEILERVLNELQEEAMFESENKSMEL